MGRTKKINSAYFYEMKIVYNNKITAIIIIIIIKCNKYTFKNILLYANTK